MGPEVRVDLGVMAMKKDSTFPKALGLDPHSQIISCQFQDTWWWWWVFTPLQRYSQFILHPQLTGLLIDIIHADIVTDHLYSFMLIFCSAK